MSLFWFASYFIFTLVVLYRELKLTVWEIGSAIYLFIATVLIGLPLIPGLLIWALILSVEAIIRLPKLKSTITHFFYQRAVTALPKLSKTEEIALNAGDTWLEQDIFRGTLDWHRLASVSTNLTPEEQAFLDKETETLCAMINEWEVNQNQDLPPSVWQYLKEQGFLGLVISKEFGGKGFSARAHSEVVLKIASRSTAAAVTVMVPNSLGPGELLQHYGTQEQKSYYLPRLAKGIDIPCFALTEPGAGSDATSIQSSAVVVQKEIKGKAVLGLQLTLNKRWITLSPVATLIGLAVNLKDPEGLLGGVGQEGITCLLISRETKGLEIGNRHLPANQAFMNGTIRGENIFVPIDSIIGGQKMAGSGWQMLVECLSIGRSISLPALATASGAVSYTGTGAFSRIRRQFNVEIAQFEGIEEKLAEIAGLSYLLNATRLLTVAAVQQQKKPSVASAITKYFNTELGRIVVTHAMDVHAGRAVVMGPRNYLANLYQAIPISITVEGANIMSRNLLIFGQGSMACHPFIREEFYAIAVQDKSRFEPLFWNHVHYFLKNFAKAVCTAWTGGLLVATPHSKLKGAYRKLARLSYAFSWIADLALIVLGGNLKRKERLSARLADGMSYLYMAMATLRFCQENEEHSDHQLHAQWATSYCFYHAQQAMIAFCNNLPSRFLGMLVRLVIFPFGNTLRYPSDKLDHKLAQLMIQNNAYRKSLVDTIYLSGDAKQPLDRVEQAFQLLIKHGELFTKVKDLMRYSMGEAFEEKLQVKVDQGALSKADMDLLLKVNNARWDALQVDEFSFDSMKKRETATSLEECAPV